MLRVVGCRAVQGCLLHFLLLVLWVSSNPNPKLVLLGCGVLARGGDRESWSCLGCLASLCFAVLGFRVLGFIVQGSGEIRDALLDVCFSA